MPKQPPVPIHIRIDTQEQHSGIPALLAAMPQVHIEVIPLRMGDYDIGGGPYRVFERKAGSDFLISLAQGRLFAQLTVLRKSRFAPILLPEGDPLRVDHSQMGPESIRGATLPERRMQIVLSLPGIGPVTARAVCARFGSLHDLLSADAAQLATVPGISPARAAVLEQLLHTAMPSSHVGKAGEA
jgi:ERCC4-type nuclease